MSLGPIKKVSGRGVPIIGDDIDTDRIIPARYLKCVTFDGIGEFVFYDERFNPDGSSKGHTIDNPKFKGANIILTGNNFGCGSSREHAPQSIKRAGFNAIIAESFAEIFFGNSLMLGIVCATMPKSEILGIVRIVEDKPEEVIDIDVEKKSLIICGKVYNIEIKDSAQKAFLEGTYDSLGELMRNIELVKEFEKGLPYRF